MAGLRMQWLSYPRESPQKQMEAEPTVVPLTALLTLKWCSTLLSVYFGVCRKMSRFWRR